MPCNPFVQHSASLPIFIFLCLGLIVFCLYFICILPLPCEFTVLSVLWTLCQTKDGAKITIKIPSYHHCFAAVLLKITPPTAAGITSPISKQDITALLSNVWAELSIIAWIHFHQQIAPDAAGSVLRNQLSFSKTKSSSSEVLCDQAPVCILYVQAFSEMF